MRVHSCLFFMLCAPLFCLAAETEFGANWQSRTIVGEGDFVSTSISPWIEAYPSDDLFFRSEVEFGWGSGNGDFNFIEEDQPSLIRIQDFYLEYYADNFLGRLGRFELDFGESFSPSTPANSLLPLDLYDPISWERLPVTGGLFSWDFEAVQFKVVPFLFQPCRNPYHKFIQGLPPGIGLDSWDKEYDLQLVSQLSWYALGTDMSLTAGIGRDPFAGYELESPAMIAEKHRQKKFVAFSASRPLVGNLTGRGSLGFTKEGGREYISGTLGISGEWQVGGQSLIRGVLEYYREFKTQDSDQPEFDHLHFGHGNSDALFYGAEYWPKENGNWSFKTSGSHNLEQEDGFIKAGITWESRDRCVKIEAGGRYAYGNKESLWGNLEDSAGVYLEVGIAFGG